MGATDYHVVPEGWDVDERETDAASLFAQFGAEVIKVEAPGKVDPLRTWRKLHDGSSI